MVLGRRGSLCCDRPGRLLGAFVALGVLGLLGALGVPGRHGPRDGHRRRGHRAHGRLPESDELRRARTLCGRRGDVDPADGRGTGRSLVSGHQGERRPPPRGDLQRRQLATAASAEGRTEARQDRPPWSVDRLPERRRARCARRTGALPARRLQPRLRRLPGPVHLLDGTPGHVGLRRGGAGPREQRPHRSPGWPDRDEEHDGRGRSAGDDRPPRPRGRVGLEPVPRARRHRTRRCRRPLRRRCRRRGVGGRRPPPGHLRRPRRGDGGFVRSDEHRAGERGANTARDADVGDGGPGGARRLHDHRLRADERTEAAGPSAQRRPSRLRRRLRNRHRPRGTARDRERVQVPVPASLRPLADDGCLPPDTPPPDAWPAIWQAVTAQLRHACGFDSSTAGLSGLEQRFPKVVAENRAAPGP